jgi:hypothetical protein
MVINCRTKLAKKTERANNGLTFIELDGGNESLRSKGGIRQAFPVEAFSKHPSSFRLVVYQREKVQPSFSHPSGDGTRIAAD